MPMGGLGGALGRLGDILRLAQWAGSAPKSDLGLDGSVQLDREFKCFNYGYFSDFLYLNFAIWKIPENY